MAWQTPKTTWGQAGQTVPGVDDFNRIEGNIETLGRYDRAPGYGIATGTNEKAITLNPAPGSYYEGLCFAFKNATQNTGAVTINVNGMGAKAIKKPNGKDLPAGFLKAGSIYTVRYNGTNFILQGSDSSGNATPEHVLAGKTFSNDTDTELTGTMPDQGAKIITPSTVNQAIPAGYHNGQGYVKGDSNLVAENIKQGISIFGVNGTLVPQKFFMTDLKGHFVGNGYYNYINVGFEPKLVILGSNVDRTIRDGKHRRIAVASEFGLSGLTIDESSFYMEFENGGFFTDTDYPRLRINGTQVGIMAPSSIGGIVKSSHPLVVIG